MYVDAVLLRASIVGKLGTSFLDLSFGEVRTVIPHPMKFECEVLLLFAKPVVVLFLGESPYLILIVANSPFISLGEIFVSSR